MQFGSQRVQTAIGLVLILILCVVGWIALSYFLSVFLKANPSVQASIIAAVVAVISLIIAAWQERSRAIREAHREQKIEVYSKFHDLIFEMMMSARLREIASEVIEDSEIVNRLMNVSRGALFYGSPKVILALCNWRVQAQTQPDALSALRPVGKILLAMREDIGLSNSGLNEINIHQLYVKDDLRTVGVA